MSVKFIQTGITSDNKFVLGNIFAFYETEGLPLNIIFNCFMDRNCVPDWIDFYQAALAAGMEHSRIISKLDEAILDSFGKKWADYVINNLSNFNLKEIK